MYKYDKKETTEHEEYENNSRKYPETCFSEKEGDILYVKHVLVFKHAWKSNEVCDYMRQKTLS